jgi:hypothetical protein
MEASMVHLDALSADLNQERNRLIEDQIGAREDRKKIERDAEIISRAFMDQHRQEIENRMREEIWLEVIKKLILAGIPSSRLRHLLDISPQMMANAWMGLGFEKLDDLHIGHVAYESEGKTGTVLFYREDVTLRFLYELGGSNALSIIEVPSSASWEKETGLTQEERAPTLNFIAQRIVRDQANGHPYQITDQAILILR